MMFINRSAQTKMSVPLKSLYFFFRQSNGQKLRNDTKNLAHSDYFQQTIVFPVDYFQHLPYVAAFLCRKYFVILTCFIFPQATMKSLHTLLENTLNYTLRGDAHALARAVTNIQYDSRRCTEDSLFVAIKGLQSDGHDYAAQAITGGARVIVAERELDVPPHVALVLVPDTRKALAEIAHVWYDQPSTKLRVFGITGTNGKTTCTFVLKHLLEAMGEQVGIIGTTGNYFGEETIPTNFTTPEAPELCALFADMRKRGATAIVMEVSSHALSLERVHGITFAGAIFTNLTQDHLDFHVTMDAYAEAKKRLFDMLPESSVAVANADDARCAFMLRDTKAATRVLFGRSSKASVQISEEKFSFTRTHVTLLINGESMQGSMPLIGKFNVENVAACVAMASALGVSTATLKNALETRVQGAPGRMQRLPIFNDQAVAIVDYAHTPDALEKALLACRELRDTSAPEGRIICVFGCGGNRDKTKRPKMGAIASNLADLPILTSDNPRLEDPLTILDDILAGIPKEKFAATTVLAERREAIRHAINLAKAGDIVLVAGKGHENYQILGAEKVHFDDVEEIMLANRQYQS
jgi:UDP-N-acetylmuramoyl-L-alanyl-D-glutamate--2,6-diaminopimelate ligase